jgi:hypothetical protein
LAERIWRTGQIYKQRQTGRSYDILTKEGRIISRNRKMVRPDPTHKGESLTIAHPSTRGFDNCVPQPPTVSVPSSSPVVAASAKTPNQASRQNLSHDVPVRRTGRERRQPDFYGNPVPH